MSEISFYRTLGSFVDHASFEAFVPPKAKNAFEQKYHETTGIRPIPGVDGYFLHKSDVNKWGSQLRLSFYASPEELELLDFGDFNEKVNIVNSPNPGEYRINNAKFVWYLWKIGFRNGHSHNRALVRNSIPHKYRKEFDEGLIFSDYTDAANEDKPQSLEELHSEGMHYTAELERKGGGGESESHLLLKRYVAANGPKFGLFVWEEGVQEYLFVSGDRCDVVFDLRDSGMAIVEVKNGELGELVKGVYQAIKYRALMQAEMGKGKDYPVTAILVAYKIPKAIREFADLFGIKYKEISTTNVHRWRLNQ